MAGSVPPPPPPFWGVTFASTRVLLEEFSALEINIVRFAAAWGHAALPAWVVFAVGVALRRPRGDRPTGGEGRRSGDRPPYQLGGVRKLAWRALD